MGSLNRTLFYLKRNGIKKTLYAVMERLDRSGQDSFAKEASQYGKKVDLSIKTEVQVRTFQRECKFSILVPAYETNEVYLGEMIDSVRKQTYKNWELIIADASASKKVWQKVSEYSDDRIRYIFLSENLGISENTNAALEAATGDYIGLLDHDDVLDKDALTEVMGRIDEKDYDLLYTDEDKSSADLQLFFEPNFKPDFNLDYLLSNNYICHFTVMKADLMKRLRFRKEYDGAQDYDLFLRAIHEIAAPAYSKSELRERVAHIPQILYHWRAHCASTSDNPESKLYAYEAGKGALEDFLKRNSWDGVVSHTEHLGFYKITYRPDILSVRKDVDAVCGRIIRKQKVAAGPGFLRDGRKIPLFDGMNVRYSGYMHRAHMVMEVDYAQKEVLYVREGKSLSEDSRILYLPTMIKKIK